MTKRQMSSAGLFTDVLNLTQYIDGERSMELDSDGIKTNFKLEAETIVRCEVKIN